MNCAECFFRDGKMHPADFVVNGQSVCQRHTHVVIHDSGQMPQVYTWPAGGGEPVLRPL